MKDSYNVIGLMSGTSGDGLDIAYCTFEKRANWSFEIIHGETVPFPEKMGKDLQYSHELDSLSLALLDVSFGKWMGEEVRKVVDKLAIEVDAVCSHGHTVFHQPQNGLSLQIGNGWAMHQAAALPVINDFRMLDVQLGGQGAPLVPIGDQLLFGEMDYCINLGGIANISMEKGDQRLAFDICPFNLLLNRYAGAFGKPYDEDGLIAKKGKVLENVLDQLNRLSYYQKQGAKSLGREDLDVYFELLERSKENAPEDIMRTLVEHYVVQIMAVLSSSKSRKKSILITGGGAFNKFFIERLGSSIEQYFEIEKVDESIVNFKEALIFGFLGVLRMRGENNCLSSVTGAKRDNCGGTAYGL
ncbi:anhydro-N-acetylmuramic acid kinase [Mongoliibacter ruber]|uniref:Anhydro-N-acetylmuramic acid kinase n=1 Tax=Mongoliibacter ruber TaxID=1750599 RepID=A0A2T0WRG6_9BACT|nr:anhydro-N-acetylmuramic acid kinase [Mongoliibacter ruber]PRY89292.1 anhydro-N-acetylmuramic acid kinase [Mongoliibacter ruber]